MKFVKMYNKLNTAALFHTASRTRDPKPGLLGYPWALKVHTGRYEYDGPEASIPLGKV
jgi:hypothetical protein